MRGWWCWLVALPALSAGHQAFAAQHHRATPQGAKRVLLLDVDGTLYEPEAGVEQQIVANIHRFVEQELSMTPQQCDQLHHRQVNDGPKGTLGSHSDFTVFHVACTHLQHNTASCCSLTVMIVVER
eukprot:TRINITY_DN234_c0_g2_i1.p1 TRINITY_DN234_c0_g2~~TRINITY_DN234_c0_g2_i1.p1  ORF type:complete len:136 (+),score=17.49 TRINITY_DN234_c0_g2_i1:33-410(+)